MKPGTFAKLSQPTMPRSSAAILLEDAHLCVNCNLIHGEHSCPLCCSAHAINLEGVLNHRKVRTTWQTPI